MTGLAAGDFVFPAADVSKLGVRGVRKGIELIFVAGFARIGADVAGILADEEWSAWRRIEEGRGRRLADWFEPCDGCQHQAAKK